MGKEVDPSPPFRKKQAQGSSIGHMRSGTHLPVLLAEKSQVLAHALFSFASIFFKDRKNTALLQVFLVVSVRPELGFVGGYMCLCESIAVPVNLLSCACLVIAGSVLSAYAGVFPEPKCIPAQDLYTSYTLCSICMCERAVYLSYKI